MSEALNEHTVIMVVENSLEEMLVEVQRFGGSWRGMRSCLRNWWSSAEDWSHGAFREKAGAFSGSK